MFKPLMTRATLVLMLTAQTLGYASAAWAMPDTAEVQAAAQAQLQTLDQEAKTVIDQLITVNATLAALGQVEMWGTNTKGRDATWDPTIGLLLPMAFPLWNVFDQSAPGWIRWVSGFQLATGLVTASSTMGFSPSNETMHNTLIAGSIAYALLGIVPSMVVATRDGVTRNSIPPQLQAAEQERERLRERDRQIQALRPALYVAAAGNFQTALNRLELVEDPQASWLTAVITPDSLSQWRQLARVQQQSSYEAIKTQNDPESAIAFLTDWLKKDDFENAQAEKALLTQELADWQARLTEQQRVQAEQERMRAEREAAEQARQEVDRRLADRAQMTRETYREAYDHAANGDFEAAVGVLNGLEWRPTDAEYNLVQEKYKTWVYAYFTAFYKYVYNLAANEGDIGRALGELRSHQAEWPTDHPDYRRMQQKIKDWQQILNKRREIFRKQGFLTNEIRVLLKESGVPVLISSDPPLGEWYSYAQNGISWGAPYYKLVYHDSEASFAIFGIRDSNCDAGLGSGNASWLTRTTKRYVSNPTLGRIGVITTPYNEYTSQAIQRGKHCYAVVTPASYDPWIAAGASLPAGSKRLTLDKFETVLKQLRFL